MVKIKTIIILISFLFLQFLFIACSKFEKKSTDYLLVEYTIPSKRHNFYENKVSLMDPYGNDSLAVIDIKRKYEIKKEKEEREYEMTLKNPSGSRDGYQNTLNLMKIERYLEHEDDLAFVICLTHDKNFNIQDFQKSIEEMEFNKYNLQDLCDKLNCQGKCYQIR